jgi:hypothetical protein
MGGADADRGVLLVRSNWCERVVFDLFWIVEAAVMQSADT